MLIELTSLAMHSIGGGNVDFRSHVYICAKCTTNTTPDDVDENWVKMCD